MAKYGSHRPQSQKSLSLLLQKAEQGEEVVIRRGRKGARFRIVPVKPSARRTLVPAPQWKGRIAYTDETVWESEWKGDE